jgi:hypothetical protein
MSRKFLLASAFCASVIGWSGNGWAAPRSDGAQRTDPFASRYHESLVELVGQYNQLLGEVAVLGNEYANNSPKRRSLDENLKFLSERMHQLASKEATEATAEHDRAMTSVRSLRNDLRALTHRVDVSPESLHVTARTLEEQRETLMLETAGGNARRDALAEALAAQSATAAGSLQNDPILIEMTKVVGFKEDAIKYKEQMRKEGVAGPAEVEAAQADLSEAKIRLAQRQQEVAGNNLADSLTALRTEITSLAVAEKEREARLQFISKRLDELASALDNSDRFEQENENLDRATDQLESARRDVTWVETVTHQATVAPAPPTTSP